MSKLPINPLYDNIRQLLLNSRKRVVQQINQTMTMTYFEIGRMIIEHEQEGKERATYAKKTIKNLSERLRKEFGKGFSTSNLEQMRQLYLTYNNRIPQTPSGILENPFKLSWSHYLFLMRLEPIELRQFYEIEAIQNYWSLRELKRQFDTSLYERLALSRDKEQVKELATKGQIIEKPTDAIKDPYVLEFLDLKEEAIYSESDLEQAIMDALQDFLLELGKGFTFVARQKRITFSEKHFRIDLVFYNRILQCFLLIDLKRGELTHQDLGQLQMYVNYYDRELILPHENKTIGLIICQAKEDAVIQYTLPEDNKQIFASQYQMVLPDKELLRKLLESPKLQSDKDKKKN